MIIHPFLYVIFSFHGCDDMKALLFPYRHDSQFLPMILLVAAFLMLSGCSNVPDALNPVEWYKDATGWFGDEEEEEGQQGDVEGRVILVELLYWLRCRRFIDIFS